MQQIYRRTLTPKCDFNKVAFLFSEILQNFYEHLFLQNTSGGCFWIAPILAAILPLESWKAEMVVYSYKEINYSQS